MPTAEQRTVFRHLLAEARRAAGLSKSSLGRKVGKSDATIGQYEAGKIAPPPKVCAALEKALGLEPLALGSHLGYGPPRDDGVTPEAAIELDDDLSAHTKGIVLAALEEGRRIDNERRAASDSD